MNFSKTTIKTVENAVANINATQRAGVLTEGTGLV